jgi:hypothetical protein
MLQVGSGSLPEIKMRTVLALDELKELRALTEQCAAQAKAAK